MIRNGHARFGRAASEKDPQGHLADVVPRPARPQPAAAPCNAARKANPQKLSRSPGKPNDGFTASGVASLSSARKRRTIIAVAAARELAGFCWAITRAD